MTWMSFAAASVVCVVLMLGPGAVLLRTCGASGWISVVFAPIVSAATVGVGGIVYAAINLRFTGWTYLLGVAIVVATCALARHLRPWPGARSDWPRAAWLALSAGLLVTSVVAAIEWVAQLHTASSVGKAYDVPWHLAIIKQMLDTGNASTLSAGHVVPTLGSGFYPASWHALTAMVAGVSGASVATAANATLFVVMAVAWPLSTVALTAILLRRSASVVLATLVLSAAFVVFPLFFVAHLGVYANTYGYALLPALLASMVGIFTGTLRGRPAVALAAVCLVGDAIAQPNAVFVTWVVVAPYALLWLFRLLRTRNAALAWAAVVLAVPMMVAVWVLVERTQFMRRTFTVDWPGVTGTAAAAGQAVTIGFMNAGAAWWLGVLVVIGGCVALRRMPALLAGHLILCIFYVLTASTNLPSGPLTTVRTYATGYWYHDAKRVGAACVMTAIPLAVLAIVTVSGRVRRLSPRVWRTGITSTVLAGACLLASLTASGMRQQISLVSQDRLMPAAGAEPAYVINSDKVAFLQRVATVVGSAGVANDPEDGSSYAYPMFGIDVTFKAYRGNWMGSSSPDLATIRHRLKFAASDPTVCPALRRQHVAYVVEMSRTAQVFDDLPIDVDGPRGFFDGLELHRNTPGFELILDDPQMRLFRVTAC